MIGHPDLDVWWCVGGVADRSPARELAWMRHAERWEACGGADDGAVDLLEVGRR